MESNIKAASIYKMIPRGWDRSILPELYEMGLIPKKNLIDGKVYIGHCRNAYEATWNADQQEFIYKRHKFGTIYNESIKHPEDDNGFDIFVPVMEKNG